MQTCRARRGFFSLRDCGETALKLCALCARPMCSPHLSPRSGFTRCLDCEGRAAEKDVLATPGKKKDAASRKSIDEPLTDPAWTHRYRDRYYSRTGYAPLYAGGYYDSYYDRYDTRSFDSSMASSGPSSTLADNDSGTGLGDS
jgi:hypothetical protein